MIKLAFIINDLGAGGIQKSLINILNELDLNKYEIDVYMFKDDTFLKSQIKSKEINIIKENPKSKLLKFIPFNLAKKLVKWSNNKKYDIVIDFDSYQFITAYYTINLKAKKRILWIHNDIMQESKNNTKYKILHFFMKDKYKYFDEFIAVSEGVVKPFTTKNKIKNKKITVIPNLINTKEINEKAKEKQNLLVDENNYNLITVGRLCHQKGYDILLKNFKNVLKQRKDIHLYIIGGGEKEKSIKKYINSNNLNKNVTLLGKQDNPFKYEKIMDGFILTSRYEGQGMAILEAYSLGLDIFITKNIEKYNGYNIKGYNDIEKALIKAKKNKNKKLDNLDDYNNNIKKSLSKILNI